MPIKDARELLLALKVFTGELVRVKEEEKQDGVSRPDPDESTENFCSAMASLRDSDAPDEEQQDMLIGAVTGLLKDRPREVHTIVSEVYDLFEQEHQHGDSSVDPETDKK